MASSVFFDERTQNLRAGWSIFLAILLIFVFSVLFQLIISQIWSHPLRATLAQGAAVLVGLAVLAKIENRSFSDFGVTLPTAWSYKQYLIGWMIGMGSMGVIVLVLTLLGWGTFTLNSTVSVFRVGIFLVMMMAVGWYEEILMRGFLFTRILEGVTSPQLKRWISLVIAILVSSGIFAFAHALNPHPSAISMVNITLAGIMLCLPFIFTRSLALSIGIHSAWNWAQGGLWGMPVSGSKPTDSIYLYQRQGSDWITGGEFGPEGGIVVSGVLIGVILLLLFAYRHNPAYSPRNFTMNKAKFK